MNDDLAAAAQVINEYFFTHHPLEAAKYLEQVDEDSAVHIVEALPHESLPRVWEALTPDRARQLLEGLPEDRALALLQHMDTGRAANLLATLPEEAFEHYLGALPRGVAGEIRRMLAYPPTAAGRFMDPNTLGLRADMTVTRALELLRQRAGARPRQELFLIDEDNHPVGRLPLHRIAIADADTRLGVLASPLAASVAAMADRGAVVNAFEKSRLPELPVVDFDGRLTGVIRYAELVDVIQEETSADIQTMVGASKDERALSKPGFAVKRRLGWLHINLLTAFVAAAVVGIFETTIAQVTALAVLLPVVAGQSGNAGAQAMAVTMRGLALHEISIRHWARVAYKEAWVGLLNGVAIAVTCGVGVFLWSQSAGLSAVIAVAMIIAMVAAGLSGALIPISLTRLGQDPAQASSILLTTVTDVVGFFAFLGIATAAIGFL